MKPPGRRAPHPRNPHAKRLVIGLVGHVCAGKSEVARLFKARGAQVQEADAWVHELYGRKDVMREVRRLFGPAVFDAHGAVDRKKLGALVFADAGKLKRLTRQIIFPRTGALLKARIKAFRKAGLSGPSVLILDAPTLFESRRAGWCDKRVFVSAPRERRERWARARRGWLPGELARREQRLLDAKSKRARCEAVIANSGTLESLDRKVGALWRQWVGAG